jgi:hypothetical protein
MDAKHGLNRVESKQAQKDKEMRFNCVRRLTQVDPFLLRAAMTLQWSVLFLPPASYKKFLLETYLS